MPQRPVSNDSIFVISDRWGMLCRVVLPFVRIVAASIGRAAFFEPEQVISPVRCGDFFTIIFVISLILVKISLAPLLFLCYYVHMRYVLKLN